MLSFAENIPTLLKIVWQHGAKKILDVGPGYGKYGLLLREQYLSFKAAAGQLIPEDDFVIDAMEVTPYFVQRPALRRIYNTVYFCDVFDTGMSLLKTYDLILLIDVVEHYEKERVLGFLRECPTDVLVSTPVQTQMYTEHFYGDPNHHKSQWEMKDFWGCGKRNVYDYSTALSHIALLKR